MADLKLHGFFNSSASYRVRIALGLKGLDWEHAGVNIRTGAQNGADYKALNPAGLVPTLEHGSVHITQSLAIIDYLERLRPRPQLVPADGPERTRVLEIASLIACDIHPLNNLRVLKYLTGPLELSDAQKNQWYLNWIKQGFDALEAWLPAQGGFCVGDTPTLADCCLVPQVANVERMNVDLSAYPRVLRTNEHCLRVAAFADAAPNRQPDFVAA
ncbi:maleylacetoacetate isomerase [Caballeronia arationis]|jgi:maleylacetoacetate isomerase|uniref:Maleylacetoacetate isomerase n=1 Tax=Caballeronia arationis TaxID=1777142 RepID=A0A7Z7I556_9BURK|nr:maleylacetoacetate isomerase [Caballeronia arationis]SAK84864.1 maleylacetoacetate isomerase [Caballeronia arationis]SOE62037.1 maleylacetoacetate isomerase [Caballeronia arationis]